MPSGIDWAKPLSCTHSLRGQQRAMYQSSLIPADPTERFFKGPMLWACLSPPGNSTVCLFYPGEKPKVSKTFKITINHRISPHFLKT